MALDIETSLAIRNWISLAGISEGYLQRGITGKQINQSIYPGQIRRIFESLAVKAELGPQQISGHFTRIGAIQDLPDSGASIGQIMAKVDGARLILS